MNYYNPYEQQNIRIYHACPAAEEIDIYLNERPIVKGLGYQQMTHCMPLIPGMYAMKVCSSMDNKVLAHQYINVDKGKMITVAPFEEKELVKIITVDDMDDMKTGSGSEMDSGSMMMHQMGSGSAMDSGSMMMHQMGTGSEMDSGPMMMHQMGSGSAMYSGPMMMHQMGTGSEMDSGSMMMHQMGTGSEMDSGSMMMPQMGIGSEMDPGPMMYAPMHHMGAGSEMYEPMHQCGLGVPYTGFGFGPMHPYGIHGYNVGIPGSGYEDMETRDGKGGTARVRFIHFSPNTPNVDITLPDGTVLFSNIGYKGITDYVDIAPGVYTLQVRPAGTDTVLLTVPNFTIRPRDLLTIYAIGLMNGTPALEAFVLRDNLSVM